MYKKIENTDLDIPKDDIDCWLRYPRHRWVYDLSRLLDAQNIFWSPFEVEDCVRESNMYLNSTEPVVKYPGLIYIKEPKQEKIITELYIIKGEIKLTRHIDSSTNQPLSQIIGELELKLNAFVSLHFSKFTGVIYTETHGNQIYRIGLRPYLDLGQNKDSNIQKLIRKIFRKTELQINGPSDQVLQEKLTQ